MNKYTLNDFEKEFPNDDACLDWLLKYRWPKGVYCEKCQKVTKHHKIRERKAYSCDYCGNMVSPTAGTIFHKSATPLRTWLQVMYRMASTRCGISAKQIQRETGVTYKTAWRMCNQVRQLLSEDFKHLTNDVEVDETYIGGKRRGKRGRGAENKSKVVGAVERKGKIVAKVVPDVKRSTITPFVTENVASGANLYTDEFAIYDTMARLGYKHLRINHSAKVYATGNVHTNSIEGFWSLVKRGIGGVFHSVGTPYLQSYINEYAFRYNHRKSDTPMFKIFLSQIQGASYPSQVEPPF